MDLSIWVVMLRSRQDGIHFSLPIFLSIIFLSVLLFLCLVYFVVSSFLFILRRNVIGHETSCRNERV